MSRTSDFDGYERDLTDEFTKLRTKRTHSQVAADSVEIDIGNAPPIWIELVNQIKVDLVSIREKDAELGRLHQKKMKVDFQTSEEEAQNPIDAEIEVVTQAIARLIRRCESNTKKVMLMDEEGNASLAAAKALSAADRTVRLNVMKTLSKKISEATQAYRDRQKAYLTSLKSQSSFVSQFFPEDEKSSGSILDNAFTEEQMNVLSQMERQSDAREQQIMRIAKSVQELAQVMHEMSVLVTEQGSILDRIDYNVSNALVDIKAGEKNVEESEEYQKKDRTCLVIAAIIMTIMIIAIVVVARAKTA
jgi:syntaxin 16